ncbi:cisplatin damage response ATP-dependent DNA ligase [Parvularcula sp. LCG005]|uniref:cisplatin damage response ATP-dependent DNA ligase n=1 Tax=Parvularcula sp. LCG005 TaxID=3078805 RepID=UPI002943DB91|nr:cisplatin damage response ATP-dependent DNA ligase [Parvularcula sp. LCG005]WOI53800.1 cisplatin damage response ATP-dependent DNA ligase [Parvularcula sp. LCG005]
MIAFAHLLERLINTPSRNGKIRLLTDFFANTPDPERGWAVAAITRDLEIASVKAGAIRSLVNARVDEELFQLSYDYVGDLAETVSLIWPARHGANYIPTLSDVVHTLQNTSRAEAPKIVEGWFDALDPSGRWALIKLITGGLRIGVAARLVKLALARYGKMEPQAIEELWHGLEAPYTELFTWLEGKGPKPESAAHAPFRPVMLAHAVEAEDQPKIDLSQMSVEYKWDGIRVQAVEEAGTARLYTRTGDDISATFPDITHHLIPNAAIDGELLVYDPDKPDTLAVRPFNDLQQRLNRKTVTKKMLAEYPAFIRAYDLLWHDGEDLRPLTFGERRERLEALIEESGTERVDISPIITAADWDELGAIRSEPPDDAIEGVMLKKRSAPYVPGRPKGEWWKWKRQPFLVDTVLMYAQRGHGKRSSFYSDYTFGVWRESDAGLELVPVGKAYHGFTDAELKKIDKFVRDNTIDRYGPVRSVAATPEKGLVFEVAFEGLARSSRHKSGVAMRFPRINRLRWDKPAAEADRIETLEAMLPAGA